MRIFDLYFLFYLFFDLSKADLTSTISEDDLSVVKKCFDSVHPCLLNSQDCSSALNYLTLKLSETTAQLLLILDQNYFGNQGSYSVFPGIGTGTLGLRASSILNEYAHPETARFEYTISGSYFGWGPKDTDLAQYLQATSPIPYYFNKIVTRGKRNTGAYINSFIIKYSLDLVTWTDYNDQEVLVANSNTNEPVENTLIPFLAKSIRIFCKTFTGSCSTQLEVYISRPVYSQIVPLGTVVKAVEGGLNLFVSSFWDILHDPVRISLNFTANQGVHGWCAGTYSNTEWVTVSAGKLVKWTKVQTQGRNDHNSWAKSIRIYYSDDGVTWISYKDGYILTANNDRNTIVTNDLEPFIARAIRVYFETWQEFTCMRFEAVYEEI